MKIYEKGLRALQKINNLMNTNNFKLVDSTYTPEQGKQVLLSIIQDKIRSIHQLCFGIEERECGDVSHFRRRVKELSAMREEIKLLMDEAEAEGLEVEIDAQISITLKEAVV